MTTSNTKVSKAMRAKTFATAISLNGTTPRKAVVVGAANGIGKACANRLAGAGFSVIAVGRDRPGRAEAVVAELNANSPIESSPSHEFRPCNAFSLEDVKSCAEGIVRDHDKIDAVVMSQGMATTNSFTPTVDGNDEKITLHYWSRMAFADRLVPSLRSSTMPGGPCLISILSGGVHGPYKNYQKDPELRNTYSIKNAADMAGYYNDLFLDSIARRDGNKNINFIHAAPGFVNSNWGSEFGWFLRVPVRCIQSIAGKDPSKCAEYMCDPIIKNVSVEKTEESKKDGVFILNEDATEGKLTKEHTQDAIDMVWKTTAEVLAKVGININET